VRRSRQRLGGQRLLQGGPNHDEQHERDERNDGKHLGAFAGGRTILLDDAWLRGLFNDVTVERDVLDGDLIAARGVQPDGSRDERLELQQLLGAS
jgi:hypothetical protein